MCSDTLIKFAAELIAHADGVISEALDIYWEGKPWHFPSGKAWSPKWILQHIEEIPSK